VSFIAANKVYTNANKTAIVWIEMELFFFTRGGCVSCLRGCLGARLLPQPYQYPNSKHWFTTSFLGGRCRKAMLGVWSVPRLRALVYDILPSTTAVFSYAIGSWKLSADEQFFVNAETVIRLLQATQIKQGVSFIDTNKVYTSTNKTTIVWIENELFFIRDGCVSCLRACFGARLLLQSY